jgi:hypothetical protein
MPRMNEPYVHGYSERERIRLLVARNASSPD